jgi:hypothetical protein
MQLTAIQNSLRNQCCSTWVVDALHGLSRRLIGTCFRALAYLVLKVIRPAVMLEKEKKKST